MAGSKSEQAEYATLLVEPSGSLSGQYSWTVGQPYRVYGKMGSCVIVDTDIEGETTSIHPSHLRFSPASKLFPQ